MASRERQPLGFILHTSPFDPGETIAPAAVTHIPILERLAVLERRKLRDGEDGAPPGLASEAPLGLGLGAAETPPGSASEAPLASQGPASEAPPAASGGKNRGSVTALLEKAKSLPFGTRLVYAGPSLESENIRLLEGMRKSQITLEYLMIDESNLPYAKHHHQIKEGGYEIL
jgi:hypothetical protein